MTAARPDVVLLGNLLVDDIVTTGATLSGCACVLLDAGARSVAAIAVARER